MLLEASVICVLLLIFYTVYRFAYAPYQVLKRCGIKGPPPLPFFGNSRDLAGKSLSQFYGNLRQEYGPVSGFYIGQKPQIMITDLDMLKQIMVKDFSSFMNHEGSLAKITTKQPKGLLFEEGETWKTNRHIISPTFSSSKMKMMVPLVEKSVNTLLNVFEEKAQTGESFDFFKIFGSFTLETILATAFGRKLDIQRGEADELTEAAHSFFEQSKEGQLVSRESIVLLTSNFPWMIPVFNFLFNKSSRGKYNEKLERIAFELVNSRRQSGVKHKDMLQLMIDATMEDGEEGGVNGGEKPSACPFHKKAGKKLTDSEVVGNARLMLLAGYETTANTLAYTSYLLAINPDIQERLQSEIDSYFDDKPDATSHQACQEITYMDNVIQESLRMYPPATRTDRECLKTTEIDGITIQQGCNVLIPIFLLHRDPQYWDEPEKFDPDRFTPEEKAKRPQLCHMPFGFGPRSCIGMRFALLEAKMALTELLKKYTFVRAPDTEVPLQTVMGITMSPKNGIYLKVVNRD